MDSAQAGTRVEFEGMLGTILSVQCTQPGEPGYENRIVQVDFDDMSGESTPANIPVCFLTIVDRS